MTNTSAAEHPRIVTQRVTDLVPYARNARTHSDAQVAQIAASITEFGFCNPILTQGRQVVAGHGRLLAARKLGLEQVPTIDLAHLTKTQARAYVLADNQLAMNAGWDQEMLALELVDLKAEGVDLDLLGFPDVAALVAPQAPAGLLPGTDPDAVPEAPKVAVTKPGDIITLGRHRLMCGDCRNAEHMDKLMEGREINVAVTSPPYASQRKYDETSGFKPIPPDEYVNWYRDVADNIKTYLAEDGSYFCNIKEHCEDGQRSLYVKDLTLAHVREWGWHFVDEFCWRNTRNGVPGGWPNRFKNAWEPVFHFCVSDSINFNPEAVSKESDGVFDYSTTNAKATSGSGLLGHDGRNKRIGMARPSNVLEIGAEVAQGDHSAPFPVALPEFFIKAFSDNGDIIFDPFMGSGTTLIAAEKNGRIAYGTEISPIYCDVIVSRWEQATGQKAVRP